VSTFSDSSNLILLTTISVSPCGKKQEFEAYDQEIFSKVSLSIIIFYSLEIVLFIYIYIYIYIYITVKIYDRF
jgi:hypothetical protein